ncbi:tyrosine-type recombinase/integrase [Actinoplanes sp. TBRC 11911]|uniref:tyrosine-type recombinase/integrase n=1 Tax=Actinoplanes sp. TBRC 11911 TaxID=2729386 RepID=UPI00145DEB72|nr:tyrosine-type recombinase/integrase [Actinoplanes sp. TBRC 11911]NMO56070.1 tyrosine-type recombinase/integrase [Actinoplanes sp. TBRC 11911]
MSITTVHLPGARVWQVSSEATALLDKFPPRPIAASWPMTRQDRTAVEDRLTKEPFRGDDSQSRCHRKASLQAVLDWLELFPGQSWQQRWDATGAGRDGQRDWRLQAADDLAAAGLMDGRPGYVRKVLGTGLIQLIGGDYLRPSLVWLMVTSSPLRIANELAKARDPGGIAELRTARLAHTVGDSTMVPAIEKIALIMAAKGGSVRDVTIGDCLEAMKVSREVFPGPTRPGRHSPVFYQLLHTAGLFPADAPPTVRMFSPVFAGQMPVEQLVDRYQVICRPVRDLLVDYLRERQPAIDYNTLTTLATTLVLWFWKDLERHHPGVDSLRLSPEIAAAWKQRIRTRVVRSRSADGQITETTVERDSATDALTTVRCFYLDLAQWALDDPARWGPWAVPSPIRATDIQHRKMKSRRKARMDQRTRDRLPVLPTLVKAVDRERKNAAARLAAARNADPGDTFTVDGVTLRLPRLVRHSPRIWAEELETGRRRDLIREEDNAFWAWAAVEVLRMTGIRVEELTELSHHSLVQYRTPSTGELIPLLQIPPSKTDEERLLVISPELADVLSAIVCRIRNPDGSVPLVVAYDHHEKTWNPPMPLLFQRTIALETRPIPITGIRVLVSDALSRTGLADKSTGKPLDFAPHDFRRIFTTDAIMNGMPPHIAQLLLGHKDINTTMGYKAVYPEEAINGHRAFIARRRGLRPGEEYRQPTDAEWDEFLGHFERRRLALGDCGRAYGTNCRGTRECAQRCTAECAHGPAAGQPVGKLKAASLAVEDAGPRGRLLVTRCHGSWCGWRGKPR